MIRSRRLVIALVAAGCRDDVTTPLDAPAPGTPVVTITTPRANEGFYMTQTAQITWRAVDDGSALTCDVVASDGTTPRSIAQSVAASPDVTVTTPWPLASVPASTSYRIEVSCRDDSSPPLVGTATSGMFTVSGPPQPVSYASQLQPLWTARCTSGACHDAVAPQGQLDLTAGGSRAALFGVASVQCASVQRVAPGAPDQSYLMFKLQGSGPCFVGSRMPKTMAMLSASELALVRDWIANGAPDS